MAQTPDKSRSTLRAHASLSAHLRPPTSSAGSPISSAPASRGRSPLPHEQQHNWVPTFDDVGVTGTGLTERAMFESSDGSDSEVDDPALVIGNDPTKPADAQEGDHTPADREGSIARRPRWRRPRPGWVYPFIVGIPLCLGMSAAPKSELYINLACLAHPPSASQDATRFVTGFSTVTQGYTFGQVPNPSAWDHLQSENGIGIAPPKDNTTVPTPGRVLSPADKWFIRLQHEIYEYERSHSHHASSPSSSSTIRPPGPEPTSPLPRPEDPQGDDDRNGDVEDGSEPEGDERRTGGPFREIDPQLCKKNAKVQASAAKLTMYMTTTMGVLAALTTGFWGQTSDRLGRTKVMAIVELGLLLNEICFITVATFPYLVPGGYRALLLGPTLEGLAGGYSTITATVYAYVSDTTPDGSRVTIFARLSGIFMAGFAVGPVLGSMLITATGNIMTPFYINACIYAFYIPMIVFVLPESLSSEARVQLAKTAAEKKQEALKRDAAEREWEDETPSIPINQDDPSRAPTETDPLLSGWSRVSISGVAGPGASRRKKRAWGNARRLVRKALGFLAPLAIFLPTDLEDGSGKDWNLTVVGIAIFCMSMVFGIMTMKGQYAFYSYGWTSAQLGPYLSLTAFARSFVLIALVPLVMRYVKPRFLAKEALAKHHASSTAAGSPGPAGSTPAHHQVQRSSHLDLLTLRICLLIELIPYILLATSPSATEFVLYSILVTTGAPSNPAANSLALSLLPDASQSGRLFGALSVLQALGSSLLSPLLYGTLYAATVGKWTPAIFALTAVFLVIAQLAISFVRLNRKKADVESAPAVPGESSVSTPEDVSRAQKLDVQARVARGRDRRVKRVSSSSGSLIRPVVSGPPSTSGSSGVSRVNP
ncbi:hypothetical protein IAU60_006694 [Kwoniella sp. DSM 27419]